MKVLIFPNQVRGNPFFQTFVSGLRAADVEDVRLSSVLRLRTNFDAIHLHLPEHVVTQGHWLKAVVLAAAVLSVALYARLTGRPIVWMMHDVEPAWVRRKTFLTAFMKAITTLTTAYIFMNKSSQLLYYAKKPQEAHKPFCFAPHSRFQTTLFDAATKQRHRQANGVSDTDILISFLGSITPNKGLECAAVIPAQTRSGQAVKLAICGVIDDVLPRNYVDTILRGKSPDTYIRVPERLTDEALALWLQSSDAVCLSYSLGSNSGMALNALSNYSRIIASKLPMFTELAERCGPSWVRCVDVRDAAAMADIVDALVSWRQQEPDVARLESLLMEGDPVENGMRLRDFYRSLRQRQVERNRVLAASGAGNEAMSDSILLVGAAGFEPTTPSPPD